MLFDTRFLRRFLPLAAGSVLLCLAGPDAAAQQHREETRAFQQAAGIQTAMLRGKQAARYDFPANGNPYWISAEYRAGDLVIDGNAYYGVPFNIDAVAQRLLVRVGDSQVAVALQPDRVRSIDSEGRHFVGVGVDGPLPAGFYEVIGDGAECVCKHVVKVLNSSPDNVNGDPIGYRDPNYRTDVSRYFALHRSYYFRDAEGNFRRVRNKAALLRCLGSRKREVRQALNTSGLARQEMDFDEFCRVVLELATR